MTHPTDEELDAPSEPVSRAYIVDGQCDHTITALRAQLAEVRAERAFTVSDGQRMLRKQDIITVCDTPDLCFESDDGVARCGPCAKKLAERDGITLNQYTVSNPGAMRLRRELAAANARADRAEAALAAQIEADAGIAQKMRENWMCAAGFEGFATGAKNIMDAIRNQPHDRTALDRMLRAEREKALREAVRVAQETSDESDEPQDVVQAILAMIEQENQK